MMRGPAEASHLCLQGAHHSASAVFFNPHELLHLKSLLFPQNRECFALEQAPSFRFTSAHPFLDLPPYWSEVFFRVAVPSATA